MFGKKSLEVNCLVDDWSLPAAVNISFWPMFWRSRVFILRNSNLSSFSSVDCASFNVSLSNLGSWFLLINDLFPFYVWGPARMYIACMYVYYMCAYCTYRSEEGIRFSETRVIGRCELSDVLGTELRTSQEQLANINCWAITTDSPYAFSQKCIVLEFKPMTYTLVRFVNSMNWSYLIVLASHVQMLFIISEFVLFFLWPCV